jgi:SAM-dependent methyltransferase
MATVNAPTLVVAGTSCGFCGAGTLASLVRLVTVDVVQCRHCRCSFVSAIHTNDRRDPADYEQRYRKERRLDKASRCWRLLPRELRDHGAGTRLLDIGCGDGGFLDIARREGFSTAGIEPSTEAAAATAGTGHRVWCEAPPGWPAIVADTFDLITMWDVLEHLPDPRLALERAYALLSPRGRLVILTPLNGSLFDRVGLLLYHVSGGNAEWLLRMCWSRDHLCRLHPAGVRAVLQTLGFQDITIRRVQVLSLGASRYAGGTIMPGWTPIPTVNRGISILGVALARSLGIANKMLIVAGKPRHGA